MNVAKAALRVDGVGFGSKAEVIVARRGRPGST
jgi:hypothetical protein